MEKPRYRMSVHLHKDFRTEFYKKSIRYIPINEEKFYYCQPVYP